MLIEKYGLFWQRERVDWGGGKGMKRQIWGATSRTRTAKRIDFSVVKSIYALYTDAFELVYVGQSGRGSTTNLGTRLATHRSDHLSERWQRFSWFSIVSEKKVKQASEKSILDHFEAVTIAISEPRLNRQGGSFGAATQYFQVDQVD